MLTVKLAIFISFLFTEEPIKLLLDAGADVCSRNQRRQSALHVAVNKGHVTSINALLSMNIHPNLQDSEGDTALHDAITKKRDDIVQLLIENGADISLANNNGFNVVHHASLRGSSRYHFCYYFSSSFILNISFLFYPILFFCNC